MPNNCTLREHVTDMRIAKQAPATITARLDVLHRLAAHLPGELLDATEDDLRRHQARFAHLQPATVDIYTRHIKAFYAWALRRRLIDADPAEHIALPRVPKGRPHPTTPEDLNVIFAATRGALRMAYTLAAFAGLRRGEICRLHRKELDLAGPCATALIHGKGGKERIVPLLEPVVAELLEHGTSVGGWIVTRHGGPYRPTQLSLDSHHHLRGLGLETTLHSMRGTFATNAARASRDPMFVRDLLGHDSVATTEIYIQTNMNDAHRRLEGVTNLAEEYLGRRAPRAQSA